MLEAVTHGPRFTISLKRSTQNLQLSTRTPADYPIFTPKSRHLRRTQACRLWADFVAEVGDGKNEASVSMSLRRLLSPLHLAVGAGQQ